MFVLNYGGEIHAREIFTQISEKYGIKKLSQYNAKSRISWFTAYFRVYFKRKL